VNELDFDGSVLLTTFIELLNIYPLYLSTKEGSLPLSSHASRLRS
jgi:hypothetical protein